MNLTSTMESNDEKIDITNMLSEVNKVLHDHLTKLLSPLINDKKNTQMVLLNIPWIKNIHMENIKLKKIMQIKKII